MAKKKQEFYYLFEKKELSQLNNYPTMDEAIKAAKKYLADNRDNSPVAVLKIVDSYMVEIPPIVRIPVNELFNIGKVTIARKSNFNSEILSQAQ